MEFLYDSRNAEFKVPYGCVEFGSNMRLTVYCEEKEAEVFLLLRPDGAEEEWIAMAPNGEAEVYGVFSTEYCFSSVGLYFYRFCVRKDGREPIFFGKNHQNIPQMGEENSWQVLCYEQNLPTEESFEGAVYYQIFPDRFYQEGECDVSEKLQPFWVHEMKDEVPQFFPDETGEIRNNDYFGGNLRGICAKLEYLVSIGTEVLYLNPIFMAFSNHRYDTADYLRIDPMLGTEEDFRHLCSEAHKYGIRILLDGVFSHTGDNSVYFDRYHHFGNGAISNPDSPYRNWYRFRNYPTDYESWWGIRTLPCVEELNDSYLEYILTGEDSVVKHWLRLGADGFRLDVADELPDEFLKLFYQTVKEEKPEALVIGEVWEDASNKISYGVRRGYFYGNELDGVMNYVYREAIIRFLSKQISAEVFMEQIISLAEHYPNHALHCSLNLLSTHDTGRIFTVLAGKDGNGMSREERAVESLSPAEYQKGLRLLSAAVFLLYTLPGSPCVYYGDEIGMQGYEDPFNRRFFAWGKEDESVRTFYQMMSQARKASEALRKGNILPCFSQNGCVAFFRETDSARVLCVLNTEKHPISLSVSYQTILAQLRLKTDGKKITLLPYGCVVFVMGEENDAQK